MFCFFVVEPNTENERQMINNFVTPAPQYNVTIVQEQVGFFVYSDYVLYLVWFFNYLICSSLQCWVRGKHLKLIIME